MLAAVARDFAACRDVRTTVLLDSRLDPVPFRDHGVQVTSPATAAHEADLFSRLAERADAVLVVAPEIGGILERRCRTVEEVGTPLLGPSSAAVRIAADKLASAQLLAALGLPTIPTEAVDLRAPAPRSFPVVVKPRDGVGSLGVRRLDDAGEWDAFVDALRRTADDAARDPFAPRDWVFQPFAAGRPASVAAIVRRAPPEGPVDVDVLPTGWQHLADRRTFAYRGGRLPAREVDPREVERIVRTVATGLPGLAGWFGLDLLVAPPGAADAPHVAVVEINPRLTTAYLGYRRATSANLAERMLPGRPPSGPLAWHPGEIEFTADGTA